MSSNLPPRLQKRGLLDLAGIGHLNDFQEQIHVYGDPSKYLCTDALAFLVWATTPMGSIDGMRLAAENSERFDPNLVAAKFSGITTGFSINQVALIESDSEKTLNVLVQLAGDVFPPDSFPAIMSDTYKFINSDPASRYMEMESRLREIAEGRQPRQLVYRFTVGYTSSFDPFRTVPVRYVASAKPGAFPREVSVLLTSVRQRVSANRKLSGNWGDPATTLAWSRQYEEGWALYKEINNIRLRGPRNLVDEPLRRNVKIRRDTYERHQTTTDRSSSSSVRPRRVLAIRSSGNHSPIPGSASISASSPGSRRRLRLDYGSAVVRPVDEVSGTSEDNH